MAVEIINQEDFPGDSSKVCLVIEGVFDGLPVDVDPGSYLLNASRYKPVFEKVDVDTPEKLASALSAKLVGLKECALDDYRRRQPGYVEPEPELEDDGESLPAGD